MFENVVQTKGEQLWTLFTSDDEEEINKAFYGRGPLMGQLGAPIFSDLMKMGQIWQWYEMDEDSKLALISGYKNYADATNDAKIYETIRILNSSLGRQLYQNFPLIAGGSLGAAVQYEIGLYPSSKQKGRQEKIAETFPEISEKLEESLEYLRQGRRHD